MLRFTDSYRSEEKFGALTLDQRSFPMTPKNKYLVQASPTNGVEIKRKNYCVTTWNNQQALKEPPCYFNSLVL